MPISEVYYEESSYLNFSHGFSHFKLQATAKVYQFHQLAPMPEGWLWYNKESGYEIGLPQPILQLIKQNLVSTNTTPNLAVAEYSATYSNVANKVNKT